MIKAFFKNSLIYTFGNIFVRGISIFLIPIYTRYLSPAEYGVIDLFTIIGTLVSYIIGVEITQALARLYQDASYEKRPMYVSTAFIFSLTTFSIYFLFCFIFSKQLSTLVLGINSDQQLFVLASFMVVTNGIFYFVQNQLKWEIKPTESIVVSFLNALIIAFVAIYLLVFLESSVYSIFIAQIIGNIASSLLAIHFSKSSYRMRFSFLYLKKMLSFSYPLVFSSIGVFITLYIDRIIIKEYLGLSEMGIYGVAYRFASVAGIVMIGFNQSLTPLIYKRYKGVETPFEIAKLFNMLFLAVLFVVSCAIFFSKEIVVIFATEEYSAAANLIPILVAIVFISNMYIFFPGLFLAKKTRIIAILNISSGIIGVLLSILVVKKFGAMGIAIVTLFSFYVFLYLRYFLSSQYYYVCYGFLKLNICAIFVLLFSYVLNTLCLNLDVGYSLFLKSVFIVMELYILVLVYKLKLTKSLQRKNT